MLLSQGIPINPIEKTRTFAGAGDGSHAEARLGSSESWAIYGILQLYQWEFRDDRYLNNMITIISLDLKITMLG